MREGSPVQVPHRHPQQRQRHLSHSVAGLVARRVPGRRCVSRFVKQKAHRWVQDRSGVGGVMDTRGRLPGDDGGRWNPAAPPPGCGRRRECRMKRAVWKPGVRGSERKRKGLFLKGLRKTRVCSTAEFPIARSIGKSDCPPRPVTGLVIKPRNCGFPGQMTRAKMLVRPG